MGLDGGLSEGWDAVPTLLFLWSCFRFFREDSLPLTSEMEGDPGRLSVVEEIDFLIALGCLLERPDGVFAPEEVFEVFVPLDLEWSEASFLASSAFLRSSSLRRSISEFSESLCMDGQHQLLATRPCIKAHFFSIRIVRVRIIDVVFFLPH